MKILAFPRDHNPYQELLYGAMRRQNVAAGYLEGPTGSHTVNLLMLPLMLTRARLQGYNTLHVHWTFPFSLPFSLPSSRSAAVRACMEFWAAGLWLLAKLYGMRLIWTAHNVRPHEPLFLNDARAHRFLGRLSDRIIVHTQAARQQLASIGLGSHRVAVIPHGNYVGMYPDTVTKQEARNKLGITSGGTVLLFFGLIRPYKGIEALLTAFEALDKDLPDVRLVIAGSVQDEAMRRRLETAAAKNPKLHIQLTYVADDQLQYLFRAADYTVLPYERSTTSGVSLLACSFDCPIIAPQQAAFLDIPEAAKITYAAGRLADGLRQAAAAGAERQHRQSRAAREYAAALSWDTIAAETITCIEATP